MFKTRLLSGIILIIIALVTMTLGGPVLAGTLAVISMIAFFELLKALGLRGREKKWNGIEIAGIVSILIYYGILIILYFKPDLIVISGEGLCLTAVIFSLVLFMAVYVFSFPKFKASSVMFAFFSFVYAPVMLSFLYLTRALESGKFIVWMILISSWGCDTCAYCVGVLIGKHKMAPKLSPKKSIEGAVGGIAGAAVLGALYAFLIVEKAAPDQRITVVFAVIGGLGAVISLVGDLAASGIKRDHEIKDYGKLIPGHGGIMDRFDSVIFTAPVIYFLAQMMLG